MYGLACAPDNAAAVDRLYGLKGRPATRPAAVMFFDLAAALAELPELQPAERAAAAALLPGPVTLLLPNRTRRFPLACGPDPDTLGLRVPALTPNLAALAGARGPALQSSANLSGGREARRLADVDPSVRAGVDLALDGGELPGVASTVLDLRDLAGDGSWTLVREGPLDRAAIASALGIGGLA